MNKVSIRRIKAKRMGESKVIADIIYDKKAYDNVEIRIPNRCKKCDMGIDFCGYYANGTCPNITECVTRTFNIITAIIFVFAVFMCNRMLQLNLLQKLISVIIIFVVFDMICTAIEKISAKYVQKIYEYKIKKCIKIQLKNDEKQERKNQKQEKKKQEESLSKDVSYKSVCDAEALVNKFEKLANSFNLGKNSEKTAECIDKLREIIRQLKDNSSRYACVAVLFEAYLPEIYNLFSYYSEFVKANVINEKKEKILYESLNKFSKFLDIKKMDVTLDKGNSEVQFEAIAKVLNNLISEEENL